MCGKIPLDPSIPPVNGTVSRSRIGIDSKLKKLS